MENLEELKKLKVALDKLDQSLNEIRQKRKAIEQSIITILIDTGCSAIDIQKMLRGTENER